MNYETIDPTIDKWRSEHDLHIYTSAKEEQVRSVHMVDRKARTYRIWIDPPDEKGIVMVHACAWDCKKRKQDWSATLGELRLVLEKAHKTILRWMTES